MQKFIRPLPILKVPEIEFPDSVAKSQRWDYLCTAIQESAEEKVNGKEESDKI